MEILTKEQLSNLLLTKAMVDYSEKENPAAKLIGSTIAPILQLFCD